MVEVLGTGCISPSSTFCHFRQAVLLCCRKSCTSPYSVDEEAELWKAEVVEPEVDVTRRSRQRLVGYRLNLKKKSHASQAAELLDSGVDVLVWYRKDLKKHPPGRSEPTAACCQGSRQRLVLYPLNLN